MKCPASISATCANMVSAADKLVVSTSCSLLHTAVDLVNETKLDAELKSWLAFAAQKIVEVNALAKALMGHKDEVSSFDSPLDGGGIESPSMLSRGTWSLMYIALKFSIVPEFLNPDDCRWR